MTHSLLYYPPLEDDTCEEIWKGNNPFEVSNYHKIKQELCTVCGMNSYIFTARQWTSISKNFIKFSKYNVTFFLENIYQAKLTKVMLEVLMTFVLILVLVSFQN